MLRINQLRNASPKTTDSNLEALDKCLKICKDKIPDEEKANNILKIKNITVEAITFFADNSYPSPNEKEFITFLLRNVLKEQVKYKEKKEFLISSKTSVEQHEKSLFKLVQILIDKGASVDGSGRNTGTYNIGKDAIVIKDQPTLLMIAIKKGLFEIADFLIDKKADIQAVSKYQAIDGTDIVTTALLSAVQKNNDNLVNKLIKLNVDLEVQDHQGNSALNLATIKGFDGIIKLLLDQGANIESKNDKKYTPLTNAVINRKLQPIQILCENNADVKKVPNNWYRLNLQRHPSAMSVNNVDISRILASYKK